MDIEKLTEIIESISEEDKKEFMLNYRIESFKRGDFDFIVKGIANNSEGDWEEGDETTHQKQKRALEILTDKEHDEFLYGGAAGGAKIVDNEGVILTPHGWKKGKDMKVGDLLNNPDGTVQRIINIKPEIYVDKWTVYFSDGTSTDVGKEHLWNAWRGRKGRKIDNKRVFGEESAEVIQTDTLKEWLDRGYTPQIPVCKPQKFNRTTREKNMIDPYLLGVLLGDGHFSEKHVNITCHVDDLNHYKENIKLDNFIVSAKRETTVIINFNGEQKKYLNEKLRLHNLLGKKALDKFIPEVYKWSSIENRWSIIQGLMDTDGTSSKDKNACYYTTISKQLAEDVAFIIRSLGGIATISKNEAGYKNENGEYILCNDAYKLYIRIQEPDKLFRLKRKQHGVFGKNLVQKRVVDVKITGKIRGRCITVSNPNGLYITNDFIVTHNSWTGVCWITFMCLSFPDTNWFIARKELKDLLGSVFKTFKKVCREYGITSNMYKFNANKNWIEFNNGSVINLIEVSYKPSDPMYEDLGSTEYTGGWIEEIGEVHEQAFSTLGTRIGRHLNKVYDIKKKLFLTCNPKQNWAKIKFYDKHINGDLYLENKVPLENGKKRPQRIYLDCLVTENPFIEQDYVDGLYAKAFDDKPTYERLFKGNWNYEDNPYQLPEQEMIDQIFDNNHVQGGKSYITADIARFGSDKAVIGYWEGWNLVDKISLDISKTTDIELAIKTLRFKYKVPKNRVVIDDDGVGGGVTDATGGIGFRNNSRSIRIKGVKNPNYANLQTQCLYLLAEKINEGGLYISADLSAKEKTEIKEELAQIQSRGEQDPERKLYCKKKSDIKQDIGRSPDWRDMIMMRVYFDLKATKRPLLSSRKRNLF